MHAFLPPDQQTKALQEAAEWLMRLHSGTATEQDKLACERWKNSSPERQKAWQQAEVLMHKLGTLPPHIATNTFRQSREKRRSYMMKLLLCIGALPVTWLVWRTGRTQLPPLLAKHRTDTGEIKRLTLADNTQLSLNTQTAVDINYDDITRTIVLYHGEILVKTGKDLDAAHYRPFVIQTKNGSLEALGTYFNVKEDDSGTHLSVLEGAVRIIPKHAPEQAVIVHASEHIAFTQHTYSPVSKINTHIAAWEKGFLFIDNQPLSEVISLFNLHYKGVIQCTPEVANIRISGAFPINNIPQSLTMITSTYPVTQADRFYGYWITLIPQTTSSEKNN